MKKVMRLVSIQLWAVLGDMLYIGKSRSNKKPKVLYASVLMFTLLMSAISFFYSFMIGTGLKMFQSLELLPALMMAVSCVIIFMTTVFKVKGTIFGFRDYDMIMSLPVSTGAVVACRLFILYVFNFMFVIIMIIPMMIAYGILAKPDFLFYIYCFIAMFFIPLVPIVIASFLGTTIAYAASKFKYSNLLNIIFSLGLLSLFIGLSFTIKDNGQELEDMGKAITAQVNSIYPLAQMFMDAVVKYDITSFLLFIVISIAAFLIYTVLVKISFKKINTLIMTGRYHTNFKMGEIKTASPLKALYIKELKRYFSSTQNILILTLL
jgi:ABC-2 type transport system permease protein